MNKSEVPCSKYTKGQFFRCKLIAH